MIPYLHAIDQHLHQIQERALRFATRQEVLMNRINDLENLQQSIGVRMGENLEMARDRVLANISPRKPTPQPSPEEPSPQLTFNERSPLSNPTSIQSPVLELGDDSPTPAPRNPIPPPSVNKLRKTSKNDNLKQTPDQHSRKSSLQRSMESGSSRGKQILERGLDKLSKPFHRRRSSEGVTAAVRTSFSFGRTSRMASINEQNAVEAAPEEK